MLSLMNIIINNDTVIAVMYNNKYIVEVLDSNNYYTEEFRKCEDALLYAIDLLHCYISSNLRNGVNTFIRIYVDREAYSKLCSEYVSGRNEC
jgi:hypothetical protein